MTGLPQLAPSAPAPAPAREAAPAPRRPRRSLWWWLTTVLLLGVAGYFLLPVYWLALAASKEQSDLYATNGLVPGEFHLWENLVALTAENDGIFWRWMLNSVVYTGGGALGCAFICALAGYALAVYDFRGKSIVFVAIIASVLVPNTVQVLPIYQMLLALNLVDTYWGVLLPVLVLPFGVYLARVYAESSIPPELLEAGRVDGAGEFRLFFTVGLRIMLPGVLMVFLFAFINIWNNFFLPLIVLYDERLYPLTLGLYSWNQSGLAEQPELQHLVVVGSFVSMVPLVVLFLTLQDQWRSGLTAGGVKF
ncbi:carbohydrate ABC transporter permease [Pseudonocardia sichuanensis]|uniref:Carbohydrate ABC transporter membrane protein 2 (CUT1 family) n=1 Tax=Pseudonocardia kunmingensis TaxID=630975 RepID=A0A543DJD4_9PSEU|nr:carbohydrate ABC transporter permease [Pseudonocardia kunmingensis]TQM09423.1 carbohydrate ABC transporter membrane protein 2 (CUT1 family) [Pseudonocardia kunmingensis]